jgi:hypothetical protein
VFLKNGVWLSLFLLFVLGAQVFASGRTEEAEVQTQNDEWILCVTDFDLSSLPAEKKAIAGVITRKVVERLGTISFRLRISDEYAFYEESAWNRSRSAAAKALAAKQEERSLLIFRGDAQWRYRQNLARLDAEIEKLIDALEEADNNKPLINNEPVFNLTGANLELTFPASPGAGTENKFCTDQKADAMLVGSVTDFHGRYVVSLKLYTVYTHSFVWEDSVIFSHDDIDSAVDEITQKLMIVLSGNNHATITVTAQPEEALVLINRSFSGRGESSTMEYPAGRVTVTASAPEYESISFETDLSPGEHTQITISLRPVDYVDVEIDGFPMSGSVYNGALYLGESPLTLRLPANQMEYIELETPDSRKGTIVYLTPDNDDLSYSLSLRTFVPVKEGSVDRIRRMYYYAWGATWLTGIAAWISFYSYTSSNNAVVYQIGQAGTADPGFIESNSNMYYVTMGAAIAVGTAAAFSIVQMIRYLYTANRGSTPIVRPVVNK